MYRPSVLGYRPNKAIRHLADDGSIFLLSLVPQRIAMMAVQLMNYRNLRTVWLVSAFGTPLVDPGCDDGDSLTMACSNWDGCVSAFRRHLLILAVMMGDCSNGDTRNDGTGSRVYRGELPAQC